MSAVLPGWALVAFAASSSVAGAEPARRVLGELGESCRAALDCRAELRCKENVCVARPEPKPDDAPPLEVLEQDAAPGREERTRLRLGLEVQGGGGGRRTDETDLLERREPRTLEALVLTGSALGVLELGLDDDQVTLGLGAGIGLPAGLDEPGLKVDLRAGWRLWRGSPSVGFWLEPRVEGWWGALPGELGLGGSLALRFRMHAIDVGLLAGGLTSLEARRKIDEVTPVREQVTVLHGALFLAFLPTVAAW